MSASERVCLIGRNGSGKSTLLKIAAGLVEPDSGSRFVQPGATIRYLPQEPDFSGFATTLAYVEAGSGAGRRSLSGAAICSSNSACTATKTPRTSRAAKPAARRWRGCWRPRPTFCCSTSRPTISISRPSNGWKANSDSRRSALVLISHDRRFLSNLSRATAWLDRGQIRQIDRGFAGFEAWRDEVLAEEERDQHKLDRKIVNEEHWLRYGVSGRRKRNVKRLGNLLRPARAAARLSRRGRQRQLDRGGSGEIRQARDRGQEHLQDLWRSQDRRWLLDPHPARRPHRHRRPERRRQDHADQDADRHEPAR